MIRSTRNRRYRSFSEVKEYIRGKFKGKEEYEKWAKSNERPKDIPTHPDSWLSLLLFLCCNYNLGTCCRRLLHFYF